MHKPIWSTTKMQPTLGQAHTPNRFLKHNTNSTLSKFPTHNSSSNNHLVNKARIKACRWERTNKDTVP